MKHYQKVMLAFAISSLAACGGGSNSPSNNIVPEPQNTPPTINSEASFTILEGARQVTSVSVSDANGDSVTLSLMGDDAGLFTLENAALLFVDAPDFESPFGGRESSVYSVKLVASD